MPDTFVVNLTITVEDATDALDAQTKARAGGGTLTASSASAPRPAPVPHVPPTKPVASGIVTNISPSPIKPPGTVLTSGGSFTADDFAKSMAAKSDAVPSETSEATPPPAS